MKIGDEISDCEDWNSVFTLECYLRKREKMLIDNQIVKCQCGKEIQKSKLDKHLKTKLHLKKLNSVS